MPPVSRKNRAIDRRGGANQRPLHCSPAENMSALTELGGAFEVIGTFHSPPAGSGELHNFSDEDSPHQCFLDLSSRWAIPATAHPARTFRASANSLLLGFSQLGELVLASLMCATLCMAVWGPEAATSSNGVGREEPQQSTSHSGAERSTEKLAPSTQFYQDIFAACRVSRSERLTCPTIAFNNVEWESAPASYWFPSYLAASRPLLSHFSDHLAVSIAPASTQALPKMTSAAKSAAIGAVATRAEPSPEIRLTKVDALVEKGKQAFERGDLEVALRNFGEAIRIDPKYPESYAERARVLFLMDKTDRAISDYTAAIQRNPKFGEALRRRAMMYLYRGLPDLALADLTQAISLGEGDPRLIGRVEILQARRSRARIYSAQHQYDREIADWSEIINAYQNDPRLTEMLGEYYPDGGAANWLASIYRQRAAAYKAISNLSLANRDLEAANVVANSYHQQRNAKSELRTADVKGRPGE